jgi:ABC-type branched-subunit amino acid transport system permease subunit
MISVSRAAPTARASGISPVRQNIYGGCILGVLGALAGVLYAPLIGYLGPDEFALSLSIICVLVGVVSTRLSFAMAIVGAVILEELTQGISSTGDWAGAIYGAIIVVVGAGMAAGQLARSRRS